MSSVHIPKSLSTRGRNSLDVERETFEKTQRELIIKNHSKTIAVQKAINQVENPVKEKHARILLIGTHKEKGANAFWAIVRTQVPLQGNPIVCWKFCHVLHKLLREGHPNVITGSQRYQSLLIELGKLWGHLKEGYGRLIARYTKLLHLKLQFHEKNPDIPGNLLLDGDKLDRVCNHNVDAYFELSVDMLDYMDDILSVQAAVFGSLDMSRSNSMTATGQCRLAPLILCIQDSCQLYDFLVKILFRLHSSLPPDTLSGHRDRFNQQYKILKQFYYNSTNLQYFKNLVRVPQLPNDPPNFLRASDLSSHVTPVVVVPEPPPEPEPEPEPFVGDLVDTSTPPVTPHATPTRVVQNSTPPPPAPDERDLIIARLMSEITKLKEQLRQLEEDDQALIASLRNRLKELQMELEELQQVAESTTQENEMLRDTLKEGEKNMEAAGRLTAMEKVAKGNEEKFKKMKDIYGSLREEHVKLLRTHADVTKQLTSEKQAKDELSTENKSLEHELRCIQTDRAQLEETLNQSSQDSSAQLSAAATSNQLLENQKEELEEHLRQLEEARQKLESSLSESQMQTGSLRQQLDQSSDDKTKLEELLRQEIANARRHMLVSAVEEGEQILRDALAQSENPHHSTLTCTAEYLISQTQPVLESVTRLRDSVAEYSNNQSAIGDVIKSVCDFSHHLGDAILLGYATSHSADIEAGQDLTGRCQNSGEAALSLLSTMKSENYEGVGTDADHVSELVKKVLALAEELLPKVEDVEAEKIGDMVDQEMLTTTQAIESAAARIADMLAASRQAQSGIELEVNERILDSCNSLMMTIKVLVERSKALQREIVAQGRGTSSAKDFYKKHHRWTEGLISAAKAVGWGANVLVDSADKVLRGEGKFEELVVCSQEIAASTTQLVVSSKVKAARGSQPLAELAEASKNVTEATAKVVASAKSGAESVEEIDTLDFSKLTLHQAKRLEMESQVHVIELESNLEKERKKLSELRKTHYRLAGESEGWDQEENGDGAE